MSFSFFEKAKNVGRSDDAYRNKKEDGLRKKYHNQTQRTTNKMKISQTKIFGCEKLSPAKKFARHGFPQKIWETYPVSNVNSIFYVIQFPGLKFQKRSAYSVSIFRPLVSGDLAFKLNPVPYNNNATSRSLADGHRRRTKPSSRNNNNHHYHHNNNLIKINCSTGLLMNRERQQPTVKFRK